jgi:ribonucleoside-diphosphate reductase alpha chain/ribonucleoside-triphosphate reductase
LCNLTTINVFAFILPNGTIDEQGLLEAQKMSARAGYRMTCVELELPKWDAVQKRDKLVGCSLTGWQDMVNAVNMTKEGEIELLTKLRKVAHDAVGEMAHITGGNIPLLTCTVKPEGTLSQLPTVSSGVHYSHSPFYIRRVRINSDDPLVKVVTDLGFPIHPENGQEWDTCKTKVVEFPVKAPDGKTKYDVSAIEQLENYLMFQKYYTDHNTSITVHVRNNEWEAVEEFVWEHWDDIVAVSFLSLDDSFYQLLPYEAITEEEYNLRLNEVEGKTITPNKIAKYEEEEIELDIGSDGCDTGVCPVR